MINLSLDTNSKKIHDTGIGAAATIMLHSPSENADNIFFYIEGMHADYGSGGILRPGQTIYIRQGGPGGGAIGDVYAKSESGTPVIDCFIVASGF